MFIHCCKTTDVAVVTNAEVSAVPYTHGWNDNLRDSLPHLNAVVTPENLQCVRGQYVSSP